MRCAWIEFPDDPLYFLKLCHQVRLVVQSAGRIDQQHVRADAAGFLHRLVYQARCIAADLAGDHRTSRALAPNAKLLDCRGAKRVTRGKNHRVPLIHKALCQFTDGCRLSGSVDPDHHHHMGFVLGGDHGLDGDGRENIRNIVCEQSPDLFGVDFAVDSPGGQTARQARRGGRTEVGRDQHVLEFLNSRVIETAAREDTGNAVDQPRRRFGEPRFEPTEPSAAAHAASRLAAVAQSAPFSTRSTCAAKIAPGRLGTSRLTGAKCAVRPVSGVSTRISSIVPTRLSR